MTWFHGGVAGLNPGDHIVPAPPQVVDGCPVCVVRAKGRVYTVGEYRQWLQTQGSKAAPVLRALAEADDGEPVDPPSIPGRVYMTRTESYATWYAARSRGDLYEVRPVGPTTPSTEDHFDSASADGAVVVRVVRRNVRLVRSERRALLRAWKKADRQAGSSK